MGSAHVLVEALSQGLPGDRLVVDPDVLAAISHDDAEWAPTEQAAVGVRARTEAEVQHVVRTCAELGTPVVPRGAGTGLSGGANAVGGCVILDLSRMNQIVEIDADNLAAVVQAAFEKFLDAAIALGGTVTGEHGVGILKRDGMRRELDPGSLALQSAVRSTLDPCRSSTPARASQPPAIGPWLPGLRPSLDCRGRPVPAQVPSPVPCVLLHHRSPIQSRDRPARPGSVSPRTA
jgi:FAD binding domain/FAD linked oxidases, C-terminal domain